MEWIGKEDNEELRIPINYSKNLTYLVDSVNVIR